MNLHLVMAFAIVSAVLATAALGLPAVASAQTTLGSVTRPADSSGVQCPADYVLVPTEVPADVASYRVAEDGEIHEWHVNAEDALPGAPVTLVVVRPAGDGYTVIGVDRQTVPSGAGDIATFAAAEPIAVRAGDTIGLHAGPGIDCSFSRKGQQDAKLAVVTGIDTVAVGQALTPEYISNPGWLLNLAASVRTMQDVAVTPRAEPTAYAGVMATLHTTVTNRGPGREPIEFTDAVPDGLAIESAVAGAGRCRVEGQAVRCVISGLAAGESVPVAIGVVADAPGSYMNSVSAGPAAGARDPDMSNNAGTAGLTVRALPSAGAGGGGGAAEPAPCAVPVLKGTPLRVAKSVLRELGCKVGKVKRVRSSKVRKGAVIRTSPRASAQPAGTIVDLRVSRGRRGGAK